MIKISMRLPFLSIDAFLLLITVFSISGCKVDVQQSEKMLMIRQKVQQSISIPCSVNISSCTPPNLQVSWFVFRQDFQYQLDLEHQSTKYTLENWDLKINSLSIKDCGVYYCAAALLNQKQSGAQAIGTGTTLKVTEGGFNDRQALLVTLFVLLVVYSLLVLAVIICIKTGQIKTVFKWRWRQSETKQDSKRVIFRGVVQELYKRNSDGDKRQAHSKVSQVKSKHAQTPDVSEDIYQNYE